MNETPVAPRQPVVEFVRTQRQTASFLFLALSLAFLAGAVGLGWQTFKVKKVEAETNAATTGADKPKLEIADLKRGDYSVGLIGCVVGLLVAGAIGIYLQAAPIKATEAEQRTEARVTLLAAGGLIGLTLLIFGGWFFVRWSDSLSKWLDRGESKEMRWVIIPLVMVIAGAGLVFSAIQPARSEERNNALLRRLVYGANLGLTALLLFIALVVGNVIVSAKVQSELDTTESGFYTLSAGTRELLAKLEQPITAYVILPGFDRGGNDVRQLVKSAEEASAGKFAARFVSPTNRTELQQLRTKYPRIDRDGQGILLTAGEDGKRHAFIPYSDLFKEEPGPNRDSPGHLEFVGEGQIVRELRFLAENELKPIVYFTQSNGELSIASGPGAEAVRPSQSASQMKAFLEKNYIEVKPLVFALQNPSVPADASVVVVANPQTPLAESAVKALHDYMMGPLKGKLVVLAGAVPGPNNKGMMKTGLEGLLNELDVRLGDKFIYSFPSERGARDPSIALVGFAAAEGNPIVDTMASNVQALAFFLPREVQALSTNPAFKAVPIMGTIRGVTWLEDDKLTDVNKAIQELLDNPGVQERKRISRSSRPVAVAVSEGGAPGKAAAGRAVVYGDAFLFSDEVARQARTTIPFDLISVSIDWLRNRPAIAPGIENKVYKEYTFPPADTIDTTRILYLPLALAVLCLGGFGAGVWVVRRR
ncbi:MAG TPA: Gldg family protein [Urbifossiella sp.]|nr:Gldg family protein [Urbifossiella sp.]